MGFRSMRFRSRLSLALAGIAVLSAGLATAILCLRGRDALLSELRSKALSIAASSAAAVDAAAHSRIRTRADEDTPAYREIRKTLRGIRDANRRADVHVAYLYTMIASPDTPGFLRFAVDSEESEESRSHVGDVYRNADPDASAPGIEENWTSRKVARDDWGAFLGAMAPVRGADGKAVAAVGVDLSAAGVTSVLNDYLLWGAVALVSSLAIALIVGFAISRGITRPLGRLRAAVDAVGKGDFDVRFEVRRGDELGELARAFEGMCKGLKERAALESALSTYVSPEVARKVVEGAASGAIERKSVTVLFSDIRGFTSLSESMAPERVVAILNEYFDRMVEVIHREGGRVDKFIGDGIMALFDAPGHEAAAVRAALGMQEATLKLRDEHRAAGRPEIRIGMGISTGYAVVGAMGARTKMNHTAIGEVVNIAARIEPLTKDLGAEILVSGHVFHAVKHLFEMEAKGAVPLKGVSHPITLYAVLREAADASPARAA